MTASPQRFMLPATLALLAALVGGCTANDDDGTTVGTSPSGSSPSGSSGEVPSPAASPSSSDSPGTATNDLEAGDCITDTGTAAEPNIEVLPCSEKHGFEVFATTELPEGEYPGIGEADALTQEFCREEFTGFVGIEYDASELELQYFFPVEAEWDAEGGRTAVCTVGLPGGDPTTGSLEGSKR